VVKYEDQLVPCPRGCGYSVQRKRAGDPHRIPDPQDSNKMITCKD
jgi:hypothetical protein